MRKLPNQSSEMACSPRSKLELLHGTDRFASYISVKIPERSQITLV